jgi:hypothetical protein
MICHIAVIICIRVPWQKYKGNPNPKPTPVHRFIVLYSPGIVFATDCTDQTEKCVYLSSAIAI